MFNIAAILRGRWIAIIYAAAILLPLLGLAMIGHINDQAIAPLILRELNQHPGRMPVCLIPMQREKLVKQMYDWGARNCEIHFCQVYGKFQSFDGISMPTFLPETG